VTTAGEYPKGRPNEDPRRVNDEAALAKPSKTARKAAMHALQQLGTRLVDLREEQIRALSLPETLKEALLACQQIRQHEARRRQLQWIGKLMRGVDPAPIAEALDRLKPSRRRGSATTDA